VGCFLNLYNASNLPGAPEFMPGKAAATRNTEAEILPGKPKQVNWKPTLSRMALS